jgi:hypothetical protein
MNQLGRDEEIRLLSLQLLKNDAKELILPKMTLAGKLLKAKRPTKTRVLKVQSIRLMALKRWVAVCDFEVPYFPFPLLVLYIAEWNRRGIRGANIFLVLVDLTHQD